MMDIILASKSPRRSELLTMLGIVFAVKTADAAEPLPSPELSVEENLRVITAVKGEPVSRENPDCAVLAADTVVVLDGAVFGKPKDRPEAVRMLKRLSGRTHEVYTGVAVYRARDGLSSQFMMECTPVTFRTLSDTEIEAYAATGEPLDKAGAYGVQGLGASLIRRIDGDYFNVMGLPVGVVQALLFNLNAEM